MTKNLTDVGNRLLSAFASHGITSKRVIGEHLGFRSENAIYKVLSGERELSFDSLRRFAETTGYSINWLLSGEGPPDIAANLQNRLEAGAAMAYSPAHTGPPERDPQQAAPVVEPGGETEGVSQENGSSSRPRSEAVRMSPEKGTEATLLLAHMELIIKQNNVSIEQNQTIIRLLNDIAESFNREKLI